jgi:Putative transposase
MNGDDLRPLAISNRRLVGADDGAIAFRWKDYRVDGPRRWKTMRLHRTSSSGASVSHDRNTAAVGRVRVHTRRREGRQRISSARNETALAGSR